MADRAALSRCALLALALLPCALSGAPEAEPQITFLELRLNEQDTGVVSRVYLTPNGLLIARKDLRALRIRLDGVDELLVEGETHVDLAQLPRLQGRVNAEELRLELQCRGSCLETTTIGFARPAAPSVDAPAPGAFLNYALGLQRGSGADHAGGTYELGLFNGFGIVASSGVWSDSSQVERQWLRLDTTWTYDLPDRRLRARLGDSITRAGGWGAPLRFGGVQLGTDISLQPYFVPFPTPDFAGVATVPSVVDVYVNNLRRLSADVPPGPFELQQIPTLNGAGEIVVVVRDPLGREQTVVAPYYASPALLRPGLTDYSAEAGALRRRYAQRSGEYGDPFAAGTLRHGFTSVFTGEARAEIGEGLVAGGLTGVGLLRRIGQVSASLALSDRHGHGGAYLAAGVERVQRGWSAAGRIEGSSPGFQRLGSDALAEAPRLGGVGRLGWNDARWGYWGLGYTYRRFRSDERDFEALFGSFSRPIARRTSLGASGTLIRKPDDAHFFGLTLSHSFGGRATGFSSVARQNDETTGLVSYHVPAPVGGGLGYRTQALTGNAERAEAGVTWDTARFSASADVAQTSEGNAQRAQLRGALAWLAGGLHLSRPIQDSFAVVDTGMAGVPVLQDNLEVGRTDGSGRFFLRRLRAYQRNRVAIDPTGLPLSARVETLEQEVVPRYRSGAHLRFDIRESTSVLVQLLLPDGRPVAAGASATRRGAVLDLPVSLEGWLLLETAQAGDLLDISGPDGPCRAVLPAQLPADSAGAPVEVACTPAQ